MLPCARSWIGKTSSFLVRACVQTRAAEHLPFPYPRWFRPAVQHNRYIESLSCSKFESVTEPSNLSGTAAITDRIESSTSAVPIKYIDTDNVENGGPLPSSTGSAGSDVQSASTSYWRPLWTYRAANRNMLRKGKIKETRNREAQTKRHEAQQVNRKLFDPLKINGLNLGRTLAGISPTVPQNSLSISLPAFFLTRLTGTSGENIWRHHDGSGCVIHVKKPLQESDVEREVVFIGSTRARDIAYSHLKYLESVYLTQGDYDSVSVDFKYVESTPERYARADQVRPPMTWSLRSFAHHVDAVITSQGPRCIERILYPGEETFNKVAAKVLMELFADANLMPFQSSYALRLALEFCSTRTEIASAAKNIWISAREAGVVPDIACFNAEIKRRLRVGNGRGVFSLINEMGNTHIQPDGHTWTLLFRTLNTEQDQRRFLQLSTILKPTYDRFSQEIMAQTLVEKEFKPSIGGVQSVSNFGERMYKAFGDSWLTPPVVQSMIERCTEAGALGTASEVLRLAADLHVELDAESFTAIMAAVAKTEWFEDLLLLLMIQPTQVDLTCSQQQVEIIFRAAWQQRLANTCRILWHYAASHGIIQHTMVTRIAQSMWQNVYSSSGLKDDSAACMAAVIVGVDWLHDSPLFVPEPDIGTKTVPEIVARLSKWLPEGEARHDQIQLGHLLMERDLTAWQRVIPMTYTTMLSLLHQAFVIDMAWHDQDLMSTLTRAELASQAIQIDLKNMSNYIQLQDPDASVLNTDVGFNAYTIRKQSSDVSQIDARALLD